MIARKLLLLFTQLHKEKGVFKQISWYVKKTTSSHHNHQLILDQIKTGLPREINSEKRTVF